MTVYEVQYTVLRTYHNKTWRQAAGQDRHSDGLEPCASLASVMHKRVSNRAR